MPVVMGSTVANDNPRWYPVHAVNTRGSDVPVIRKDWGMHRIVFASLAALGMTAGAASAADLGRPAPAPVYTKAPMVAPLSWTGCYLGGNAGGAWANNKDFDVTDGLDFGSDTTGGFIGGGQGGCDYQAGAWVLGVQGSYDWADLKGSHDIPDTLGLATVSNDDKYLATATARIGYAVEPSLLLYAKGGAAWTSNDITVAIPAFGLSSGAVTDNRLGWTAGAGVEYMFAQNWSVFGEYKFADFGTKSVDFPSGSSLSVKQDIQSAVAGVNFHLRPW
jgi:outer membrane immunogenic protein